MVNSNVHRNQKLVSNTFILLTHIFTAIFLTLFYYWQIHTQTGCCFYYSLLLLTSTYNFCWLTSQFDSVLLLTNCCILDWDALVDMSPMTYLCLSLNNTIIEHHCRKLFCLIHWSKWIRSRIAQSPLSSRTVIQDKHIWFLSLLLAFPLKSSCLLNLRVLNATKWC